MRYFKFIILLYSAILLVSCQDMLMPENERYTNNFAQDTTSSYWGIMKGLQKVAPRTLLFGESRGDMVVAGDYLTDSLSVYSNFIPNLDNSSSLTNITDFYSVINLCNYYLQKVDTTLFQFGEQTMIKEYAQVQLIRAWVYMKLVDMYGEVPFLTEPVEKANSNIEQTAQKVNISNLRELLLKNGLANIDASQKKNGLPNYGTYSTGSINIPSLTTMFDANVVLGDLYLSTAKDTADYEKAAEYYFAYIKEAPTVKLPEVDYTYNRRAKVGEQLKPNLSGRRAKYSSYTTNNGIITQIPIAANATFGYVNTELPNAYGFFARSHQSTVGVGDTANITIAGIQIIPDEKYQQLYPSKAAINLAGEQEVVYAIKEGSNLEFKTDDRIGDGRYRAAAPEIRTNEGLKSFVGVYTNVRGTGAVFSAGEALGVFSAHYAIPLYTYSQVVLRYAEAINRAGYPSMAFAVLRNGLNYKNIPSLAEKFNIHSDTTFVLNPTTGVNDTIIKNDTLSRWFEVVPTSDNRTFSYISEDELQRANTKSFFDFKNNVKVNIPAIHALGAGSALSTSPDTIFSIVKMKSLKKKQSIERFGAEWENAYTNEDLVEDLIADEMALELMFEGGRYFDLLRIARHKNNDATKSNYGTIWLAWKIASRNGVVNNRPMDEGLYQKLLDAKNWYLAIPQYK